MRIVFLVPDGVGTRNYLFSNLLEQLTEHEIILLHQLPDQLIDEIRQINKVPFKAIKLPPLPENRQNDIRRKICMYARLHLNSKIANNPSIKENYLTFTLLKGKRKIAFKAINYLAKRLATNETKFYAAEYKLFKQMLASESGKTSIALLQSINPDVVFCTHQRSVEAGYIMTAANALNINTNTVIFSWDNLPKSRINFLANKYLVWSTYMQAELLKFYSNIKENQIVITGTPQFDFYTNPNFEWTKESFNTYFNIPTGRQAICFSGNEPSFPSDHLYLKDLLEQIDSLPTQIQPFVIVRPSPVDHTTRMDEICKLYPQHCAIKRPEWKLTRSRDWESYTPTFFDSQVLVNLAIHCLAVINIGSTMAVDFAQKDKPAMYIRYNHPECAGYDLLKIYEQEHLLILDKMDAVIWVKSKTDFADGITKLYNKKEQLAKARQTLKYIITNNITDATNRIAKAITS